KCHGESVMPSDVLERAGADDGVRLHHRSLRRAQLSRLQQDMIRQANLANIMQGGAAFEHPDEIVVEYPGEWGMLGGFLSETPAIALKSQKMRTCVTVAALNQLGEGHDQGVASMDEIAVSRGYVSLEVGIHCQQVPVQQIRPVLCLLQAKRGLHTGL